MRVHNWDSYVGSLRGVVITLTDLLPPADIEYIWDSIEGGEPGIAFEDLCTQLQEYEVPVNAETRMILAEIGEYTGFDPKLWREITPSK